MAKRIFAHYDLEQIMQIISAFIAKHSKVFRSVNHQYDIGKFFYDARTTQI